MQSSMCGVIDGRMDGKSLKLERGEEKGIMIRKEKT